MTEPSDHEQIRQVIMRYFHGVDRRDWEVVRGTFGPDAVVDYGAYQGGVDGFLAWAAEALGHFDMTMHFAGNLLIDVDSDTANTETYAIVRQRRASEDAVMGLRYVDRLERGSNGWVVRKRRVLADWSRVDAVEREVGAKPDWAS